MRIGIFDSGRGGEFVANDLRELLPDYTYMVVNDREHVPYGSRSSEEIVTLTDAAIQPLIKASCQIIIIACNTATLAAIAILRLRYPHLHFIGIEPMIKPAASLSRSRHITVLATPLTLKSDRYRHLVDAYAHDLIIDEPDTSGWAAAIEHGRAGTIDLSDVSRSVRGNSDCIVLACTHYHILRPMLRTLFPPNVAIIEPTTAIARQLERLAVQVT